jgi:hypothetical protein
MSDMRKTLAAIGTAAVTFGVPAGLVLATTVPASACSGVASRGTAPLTCSGNGGGYGYAVTATPQPTGPGDTVTAQMTLTPIAGNPFDGTADTRFSIAPDGTCSGDLCTPATWGPHTITGQYSAVSATGSLVSGSASTPIIVLPPASLRIVLPSVPDPSQVQAGQTVPVTVQRLLADGTVLDDVSNRATVTLGGKPCPGAVCTATAWGKWDVTAALDDLTASTEVFVNTGPAVSLQVKPHTSAFWDNEQAGSFTVEAVDAGGNGLEDLTADSSFAIAPDGTCTGNVCMPATGGSHTVTATYKSLTGSVTLDAAEPIPTVAPALPSGTVGTRYSASVIASGHATSTTLGGSATPPPGLTLGTDGILSGVPTTAGTYTFFVVTSNASGGENEPTTITITPRTTPAKPKVSIGSAWVREGNSGRTAVHVTVRLSAPSRTPVTVAWHTVNGTARAGQDYVAAHGVVRIPAGRLTAQITVYVIGDRKAEPTERFGAVLSAPSGATLGTARGTVTIKNDD